MAIYKMNVNEKQKPRIFYKQINKAVTTALRTFALSVSQMLLNRNHIVLLRLNPFDVYSIQRIKYITQDTQDYHIYRNLFENDKFKRK